MDKYIGKMLDDRYEIIELIGSGGMANGGKSLENITWGRLFAKGIHSLAELAFHGTPKKSTADTVRIFEVFP